MDIALLRELVDASVRPGQPRGSVVANRVPAIQLLTSSRPVSCNRYDWSTEADLSGALYGRARYGVSCYLAKA